MPIETSLQKTNSLNIVNIVGVVFRVRKQTFFHNFFLKCQNNTVTCAKLLRSKSASIVSRQKTHIKIMQDFYLS